MSCTSRDCTAWAPERFPSEHQLLSRCCTAGILHARISGLNPIGNRSHQDPPTLGSITPNHWGTRMASTIHGSHGFWGLSLTQLPLLDLPRPSRCLMRCSCSFPASSGAPLEGTSHLLPKSHQQVIQTHPATASAKPSRGFTL